MSIQAILLFCLLFGFSSAATKVEVTAEAPSNIDINKVIEAIQTAGKFLDKYLTKENIEKVMKFGKAIFEWGKGLIEQVKQLRNTTEIIKGRRNLAYVKKEMDAINAKLSNIDRKFASMKHSIDWNIIKVNVGHIDGTINSLTLKLNQYLNAPSEVSEVYKDMFLEDYKQNFDDAPLKLFLAITEKHYLFRANIFEIARKQFKNDFKEMAHFAGYLVRLLQKGIGLKIAYYGLTEMDDMVPELEEEWKERFEKLEQIGKESDQKIRNAWRTQSKIDLDAALINTAELTNDKLATELHEQLTKKYPWRQWFVLVFKFTDSDKERFYKNCEGFEWPNVDGKSVIVDSVAANKTSPRINVSEFFKSIPATVGNWSPFSNPAQRLFDLVKSSCDKFTFKGVIHSDADVQMKAHKGRASIRSVAVKRYFHFSPKHYMLVVFD